VITRQLFRNLTCVFIVGLAIAQAQDARATPIFDAANDFNLGNNPNNVWSYGFSSSIGGSFTPFTETSTTFLNPNFETWLVNPQNHPFITRNTAATNQQGLVLNLNPGKIALHPGPDSAGGLLAVLRWTAPSSQAFTLDAVFEGRDTSGGATTDVHILHNGVSLLDGEIDGMFGTGSGPSFSSKLFFNAGDTIDFVVGNGGNDFPQDGTGLDATFTAAVPEPMSLLGLFSVVGITAALKRKGST